MRLWLRARGARQTTAISLGSIAVLTLPVAGMTATPSPGGATIALAVLVALLPVVALGWAMSRGRSHLDEVSPRPIWALDIAGVLLVLGVVILGDLGLRVGGLAAAGAIAARAVATFGGLMLGGVPVTRWSHAAVLPTLYFLSVVVAGRGADAMHPAPWAWIAAAEDDAPAAAVSLAILLAGPTVHVVDRLLARGAGWARGIDHGDGTSTDR